MNALWCTRPCPTHASFSIHTLYMQSFLSLPTPARYQAPFLCSCTVHNLVFCHPRLALSPCPFPLLMRCAYTQFSFPLPTLLQVLIARFLLKHCGYVPLNGTAKRRRRNKDSKQKKNIVEFGYVRGVKD